MSQPRAFSRGRFDNRSTDRDEGGGKSFDRYQRSESYVPSAERTYQNDDRKDFRRGRSPSISSARSDPPFKRGRRFGSVSRSPGRLMISPAPIDTVEWPPCFEIDGSAFVFHPASGMFYEEKSEFFYDPKTKLYYGAKKFAYFRYDEDMDPPFVETQRADPSQGTPTEPVEPPLTLPPVNGVSSTSPDDKPKIAIKLKTKKLKKSKGSVVSEASETITMPVSKVQKEQEAILEKWREKQAELKALHPMPAPVSAAAAAEEIKRTIKGEPICVICKRKFPTIEKLRLHETKSELHKSNLAKAAQLASEKAKLEQAGVAEIQQYKDRAEKRRHLHGIETGSMASPAFDPLALAVKPEAEGLGENHIGNKLLQKMGWQAGTGLAKKGEDDESDKSSSVEIRKDWERIEALAGKGRNNPQSGQ